MGSSSSNQRKLERQFRKEHLKLYKKENAPFRLAIWKLAEQLQALSLDSSNWNSNRICGDERSIAAIQEGIIPFRPREEPRGFTMAGGARGTQLFEAIFKQEE